MKIYSWNVNGIRAAQKKGFLDWLNKEAPDILAIQETKASKDQLDNKILEPNGYYTFWSAAERKGYSGTAIFSKIEPKNVTYKLGKNDTDNEGRTVIAEYEDFTFINAYFPNSRNERARLPYKIEFGKKMKNFCNSLVKKGKNILLCGDFNIAHKAIDLARPEDNEDSPGYYIEERTWMDTFIKSGFIDTFRHFNDQPDNYTWWSYRTRARERNVGWRIDYHVVNKAFINKVNNAYILSEVHGSDHCPVGIELK